MQLLTLKQARESIQQQRGNLSQLNKQIEETKQDIKDITKEQQYIEEAQNIIQLVAKQTQQQLEDEINELTTLALKDVFEKDAPQFVLEFVIQRNKTECKVFFEKNGNRREWKGGKDDGGIGGGVARIAALAIRICTLRLKQHQGIQKVLLVDEPVAHLHNPEALKRTSLLLKEISKKLGIQIIMVSGDEHEEMIQGADNIINVINKRGVSYITQL